MGKKTSYSFHGVSGVVSWNIGDSNKMKSGVEHSFKRKYDPSTYSAHGPVRPFNYKKDPNFVVTGSMADASKGYIKISLWPKSYAGLNEPTNYGYKQMVDFYNREF